MTARISTDEYKKRANHIHNSAYDYSLWIDDVTSNTRVINICTIHGKFEQTVNNHINQKQGCPQCGRERAKNTSLEKYGTEHPFQSDVVKEKIKQSNLKKYGVENPSQSKEIKIKKRKTTLSNYGVEYPYQSPEIQERKRTTNNDRYGVDDINQQNYSLDTLNKINNKDWLIEQHHHLKKPLLQISNELGDISNITLGRYYKKYDVEVKHFIQSQGEVQVRNYIRSLGHTTLNNKRNIIPPYEIDIFIEELNVAIEYNGDYWHGEDFPETQEKDIIKQQLCDENNITLFVVNDSDWNKDSDKIKKSIQELLNDN